MWKKIVTIDKRYGKEYAALVREISKNKSLVCATEEGKSRVVINLAARDGEGTEANGFVCDKIARLLTTYFKHSYVVGNIGIKKFDAAAVSLLAVMVYYDSEADYAQIFDKLKDYSVISVDGVFNFAMRGIKEDWDELCAVSGSLFDGDYDEEDLYDVARYVVDEKADRARLLIADETDPVVTDMARGGFVTIDDFYGDPKLNLVNCVVGKGAKEVTLDASFKDKDLVRALSRFAKVRSI